MDLSVSLPGLELKNPIMPASGCFGFGREYSQFYDLGILRAVIITAATVEKRVGYPTPCVAEVGSGILNASVALNPGVELTIEAEGRFVNHYDTFIIAMVAGSKVEEYDFVAGTFNQARRVSPIELSLACQHVQV